MFFGLYLFNNSTPPSRQRKFTILIEFFTTSIQTLQFVQIVNCDCDYIYDCDYGYGYEFIYDCDCDCDCDHCDYDFGYYCHCTYDCDCYKMAFVL